MRHHCCCLYEIVCATHLSLKQRTFCIWFKLISGKFISFVTSTVAVIYLTGNNSENSFQKFESPFLHMRYCTL